MDPGQVLPPRPDQHVRLTNDAGCDARCDARTVVVELTKAIQSQLVALGLPVDLEQFC